MLSKQKRLRLRVGDILELPIQTGFAYLQYVMKVPRFGVLVRVLRGTFVECPRLFSHLANQPESFVAFFPVGAAVAQGILRPVAHESVPERLQVLPLFRAAGNIDPKTGKVLDWWLWDGERSWPVGELRPEHRHLPIQEVLNDTMLVQRIEDGWTPEDYR